MNYYNILGVSSNATSYELKQARDNLARKVHSDKGGNDERMKVINEAYRVLKNPELRKQYDLSDDVEDDLSPVDISGFLHVGRKWSEEFMKKFNVWKYIGKDTQPTSFVDPNNKNYVIYSSRNSNVPLETFKPFLIQAYL